MSNKLSIALAQVQVSQEKQTNLATAERCIAEAVQKGAELIAFPEMFMACPKDGVPLATIAETLDGSFIASLAAMARQYRIAIVCGVWETAIGDNKRAANVAIALNDNGDLIARYNKIHLFNALNVRESDQMLGGNCSPPIFELNGVKIGLGICYDLRFRNCSGFMANNGADAVIVPAAWYSGPLKEDHWLCLLRARAIENTMYVAGVDLCGAAFSGRSTCFDPFGVPLVDAGEGEAVVVTLIDSARITTVRGKLPCLKHIRGDLF